MACNVGISSGFSSFALFLQVGAHEEDIIFAPFDLSDIGLEAGFAQVPFQSFTDSSFIVFESSSISHTIQPASQGPLTPSKVCAAEPT